MIDSVNLRKENELLITGIPDNTVTNNETNNPIRDKIMYITMIPLLIGRGLINLINPRTITNVIAPIS